KHVYGPLLVLVQLALVGKRIRWRLVDRSRRWGLRVWHLRHPDGALARVWRWCCTDLIVAKVRGRRVGIPVRPMGLLGIKVGEKHVLSDIDVHSLERDRAVAASYFDLGHRLSFRFQPVF